MILSGTGTGLPALPLPPRPRSRSRRVQQRHRRRLFAAKLANEALSTLNVLSGSRPMAPDYPSPAECVSSCVISSFSSHFSGSSSTPAARAPLSATAARSQSHVLKCASLFVSRLSSRDDSSSCSVDLVSPPSQFSPLCYSQPTVAIPLVADRVSLPPAPGSASLLDLLPPHLVPLYSGPEGGLILPEPTPAPKPSVFAAPREYAALVRRLHGLGMVEFRPDARCVNGVFGVRKGEDMIRFIVNAVPANRAMTPPVKVVLPGPDLITNLQVPPDRPLYVAKLDICNYYHRIGLPAWLRPYFALPSVRAGDVGVGHVFGPDVRVFPCCTTLPMGWSHSAFIAQSIHEHILDSIPGFREGDRLTAGNDFSVDRPRHQVYIDDCILYGHDPAALSSLQDRYMRVFAARGLPVKPSKLVRPSADGVESLGLLVDGRAHTVGLAPDKLRALQERTRSLVRFGSCSGDQLSVLLGHWTWAILVCRSAFSVFKSVYRFVQVARGRVFRIWPSVARELLMVASLAPLLFAQLDSPWFSRGVAVDASTLGNGVVSTPLAPGSHAGFARAAASPVDCGGCGKEHCRMPAPLRSARWSTIVSSPWAWKEHINVLEARSVFTALRWVLSSPLSVGRRLLVFSDSTVVVGALSKGRSPSYPLLVMCRRVAALCLGSGLRVSLRWVPSDDNPADGPSRLRC